MYPGAPRASVEPVQLSVLRPLCAVRAPLGDCSYPEKVLATEWLTPKGCQRRRPLPNGKVLSSPLRPHEVQGSVAFPLVRALLVGATGFEPVTSSVSGIIRLIS
jgi:hypothetical protein